MFFFFFRAFSRLKTRDSTVKPNGGNWAFITRRLQPTYKRASGRETSNVTSHGTSRFTAKPWPSLDTFRLSLPLILSPFQLSPLNAPPQPPGDAKTKNQTKGSKPRCVSHRTPGGHFRRSTNKRRRGRGRRFSHSRAAKPAAVRSQSHTHTPGGKVNQDGGVHAWGSSRVTERLRRRQLLPARATITSRLVNLP